MSELDELLSIAEIAVTIAGFAALVSVLAWRRDDFDPRAEGLRLVVALEASLFVAAFSLLPMIPQKFGVDDAIIWRVCALCYLLSDLAFSLVIAKRIRGIEFFWPNAVLARLIWFVSAIGQLLLLVAVIGYPADTSAAFYYSALYLNLINSGLLFLVVAWNTFIPR